MLLWATQWNNQFLFILLVLWMPSLQFPFNEIYSSVAQMFDCKGSLETWQLEKPSEPLKNLPSNTVWEKRKRKALTLKNDSALSKFRIRQEQLKRIIKASDEDSTHTRRRHHWLETDAVPFDYPLIWSVSRLGSETRLVCLVFLPSLLLLLTSPKRGAYVLH